MRSRPGRQGHLGTLLAEAREWADAPQAAEEERQSDWALICLVASEPCNCAGGRCLWQEAARSFFARNTMVSEGHLAHCLAKVITEGPSKTARVPLIAGASNTGKSTMLDPIDVVFREENVLHKPSVGATMPLANVAKPSKRFMHFNESATWSTPQCRPLGPRSQSQRS